MKKRLRDPVNGLTHLAGGLLAVVGLGMLLATAASAGRVDQLVAFGIFGLSLIALYTASMLYHLLPLSPEGVAKLRLLDHVAIFVLIAGTYTPFCLLALYGGWNRGLLVVVWSLALCGVDSSSSGWTCSLVLCHRMGDPPLQFSTLLILKDRTSN